MPWEAQMAFDEKMQRCAAKRQHRAPAQSLETLYAGAWMCVRGKSVAGLCEAGLRAEITDLSHRVNAMPWTTFRMKDKSEGGMALEAHRHSHVLEQIPYMATSEDLRDYATPNDWSG